MSGMFEGGGGWMIGGGWCTEDAAYPFWAFLMAALSIC